MQPSRSGIRSSVLLVLLLSALLSALLPSSAAQAAVGSDDYPYKTASTTAASDPWMFTKRQCVSFAAWRLAQSGRTISNKGNAWGHAYNWDTVAVRKGKTVSSNPRAGAIAHWNAGNTSTVYDRYGKAIGTMKAGSYGHVAYVIKVINSSKRIVLIEQYNMSGNRNYSQMRVTAPRYLYL